jgi:hypothetical protein
MKVCCDKFGCPWVVWGGAKCDIVHQPYFISLCCGETRRWDVGFEVLDELEEFRHIWEILRMRAALRQSRRNSNSKRLYHYAQVFIVTEAR